MSFLDTLKKTFTYRGDLPDEEVVPITKEDKPRLNIGNPIQRAKDVKNSVMSKISEASDTRQRQMSGYTKSLIYKSLHFFVEQDLGVGKPVEEATLLFKRFMEDKVTDEGMYTDEDLKYISSLVKTIRDLKSPINKNEDTFDVLCTKIIGNKYFLQIVEVLDTYFGHKLMDAFCENSYIVCGFSYSGKDSSVSNKIPLPKPAFELTVNDSSYYLLNEVSSIISMESSNKEREEYIVEKTKGYFKKYAKEQDISLEELKVVDIIFSSLDNTVPIVPKTVEQPKEPEVKAPIEKEEDFELPTSSPINSLKQESKLMTIYSSLVEPFNEDVTKEDLISALSDIDTMVLMEDYIMSPAEFKLHNMIKSKLKFMTCSNEEEVPEDV